MKGHNWGLCRKCGKVHNSGRKGKKFTFTKEHIQNISKSKLGKSNNHKPDCQCSWCKAKRGETKGEKNNFYGKHHTRESKDKLRANHVGVPAWNKNKSGYPSSPNYDPRLDYMVGDDNPSKRTGVKEKIRVKAKQRFEDEEWRKNFHILQRKNGLGFSLESQQHVDLKVGVKKFLEELGYNVIFEYVVKLKQKWYIVDVAAFRSTEPKIVMVECGGCSDKKLDDLKMEFDKVFNIPLEGEIEKCISV